MVRTLWVGDLEPWVDEKFMHNMFASQGYTPLSACKSPLDRTGSAFGLLSALCREANSLLLVCWWQPSCLGPAPTSSSASLSLVCGHQRAQRGLKHCESDLWLFFRFGATAETPELAAHALQMLNGQPVPSASGHLSHTPLYCLHSSAICCGVGERYGQPVLSVKNGPIRFARAVAAPERTAYDSASSLLLLHAFASL
jgi:hypothetical protein